MTKHTDNTLRTRSTRVSWLLRHGANERRLAMDTAGFAPIADVLRETRLSRPELDDVVAENNKQRFQIVGDRIRAVQGHSLDGTPVTLAGLEASWNIVVDDAPLFHGTSVDAARAILTSEGVHAAARSHVHLAAAVDATVGKRAAVDVLLVVDPRRLRTAGLQVFRAPNGVLLARAVPRMAVVAVRACTRRGNEHLASLTTLVHLETATAATSAGRA
jgi:putative RNA 2'-phosphotransferase